MTLLIENCTVKAGTRTILDLDEVIFPQGKITAVIGPNGAGKSTLLKQLLVHPQTTWQGLAMKDVLSQGKLAWVGQHEQFSLPMTLVEYCMLAYYPTMSWYRRPKKIQVDAVIEMLKKFDLGHLQDKRIETLSGGEQQRAAVVRALLQKSEILLMDEPTNHLDIRHQHHLMHNLREQFANQLTIVMVLHDLNLALHYADYAILMNDGKIVASGVVDEIMNEQILSDYYQWQILKHQTLVDNHMQTWFQPRML